MLSVAGVSSLVKAVVGVPAVGVAGAVFVVVVGFRGAFVSVARVTVVVASVPV